MCCCEEECNCPDATEEVAGIVELATSAETTAGLAVQASDTRLSDARTPTAHASTHLAGGSDPIAAATETARGTVELATSAETAAGLAVQASDTRLSDARTPTAHASTHIGGGSDPIPATPILLTAKEAYLPSGLLVPTLSQTAGGKPVLLFNATDDAFASFFFQVGPSYAGAGLTFRIWWAPGSAAGPGDVVFGAFTERMTVGESVATYNGANATNAAAVTTGTVNLLVATDYSISHAQLESPASGDWITWMMKRMGSAAGDTFVGDAQVLAVQVLDP